MQRFYDTVFVVGLVAMATCIGLGLLVCLGAPALWEFAWAPWVTVVGPLILVCIPLRFLAERLELRWPRAMTRRRFFWLYGAATLLLVGAIACGLWWWPAAPLTPRGGAYVDKLGTVYSREQFDAFDRWQAVLNYFCLAFAIGNVVFPSAGPTPPRRTAAGRASTSGAAGQSICGPATREPDAPRIRSESVHRQARQVYRQRE